MSRRTDSDSQSSESMMTTSSSAAQSGRTASIISAYREVLKVRAATSMRTPAWLSTNCSSWVR